MVDSKPFTQLISFKNMILCVVYVTRANVCLCVLCMRMLDECLMLIIINAATENFNTHGFFLDCLPLFNFSCCWRCCRLYIFFFELVCEAIRNSAHFIYWIQLFWQFLWWSVWKSCEKQWAPSIHRFCLFNKNEWILYLFHK